MFVTVITAISNDKRDNALALTPSTEFTCPRVLGLNLGKTRVGFAPLGFHLGDPSIFGCKSLYLLASLVNCYNIVSLCLFCFWIRTDSGHHVKPQCFHLPMARKQASNSSERARPLVWWCPPASACLPPLPSFLPFFLPFPSLHLHPSVFLRKKWRGTLAAPTLPSGKLDILH